MIRARRWAATAAATCCGLSACAGGGGNEAIQFDSTPTTAVPSTTSTPPTTEEVRPSTTVARPEPEWRRATGNLQGMPSECGNLSHVWSRPDTDEVIAGVALHGLWVNDTPRRDHWTQIGTGEGSDVIAHRPTSLVFDPEHPDTYWETGNYHEAGVYRTDDGGATFHHLGDAYHIDALSVDFTDPERRTLLAAVHESASVLRSTDGGETWEDVSASLPADTGFSIGPLVIDSSTFVLGTKQGPNAGVFRTTDGGTTWTKVNDEGVITPPLVATDGKIYFIPEGGALIASGDGGQTWDRVTSSTQLPASTWPVLMEMPDGRFASTRGDSIILSADGGGNWERVASLPYEPTGLAYAPDRKMFYIWKFDCSFTTDNDVPADAIMKLPFDYEKE